MTADTVGGVWTYAVDLAKALAPTSAQITIATMGGPLKREHYRDLLELDNVDVYESAYKLEWFDDPWDDVAESGEWLLELEERCQPDIVHLNGFAHGALPFRAHTMIVAHSCVFSWWRAVKGEFPPESRNCYRMKVERGLNGVDAVIAPTRAMLDMLLSNYAVAAPSCVIPNGRNREGFRPAREEPFLLSAGRLWDEAKNIHALDVVAAGVKWPIYVAGEPLHPSGHTVAPDHLRMLGQLNKFELADWMARAAIYALPARYEPFGLSVLEAAISGCTLVLGDIPSLREVWADAALYVAPDDHDGLRKVLNGLIDDEQLRNELSVRAQARAEIYTLERMGEAYWTIYHKLVRE